MKEENRIDEITYPPIEPIKNKHYFAIATIAVYLAAFIPIIGIMLGHYIIIISKEECERSYSRALFAIILGVAIIAIALLYLLAIYLIAKGRYWLATLDIKTSFVRSFLLTNL